MDWFKQIEIWLNEGFDLEGEKVKWEVLEKKPQDKPNLKGQIKVRCKFGDLNITIYEKYLSLIALTNIKNTYSWTIKEKVHAYKIMLKLSYEVPVCYAVLLGENDDVAIEGDIDLSNVGLMAFQNTCMNVLAMKDILLKRFKAAGIIQEEQFSSKEAQFITYVKSMLKGGTLEDVAKRVSENSGRVLSYEDALALVKALQGGAKK